MGWSIHLNDSKFVIKRKNQELALKLARDMPVRKYSWGAEPHKCWELSDVFREFFYEIFRDPTSGDVTSIELQGEKMGDEQLFFEAIAPVVEAGSFLEFGGDSTFRWKFEGGKLIEQKAKWE